MTLNAFELNNAVSMMKTRLDETKEPKVDAKLKRLVILLEGMRDDVKKVWTVNVKRAFKIVNVLNESDVLNL